MTLVQRLAIEKLEAKAEELRPRWAWTKPVVEPEYGFMAQYARLQPKPGKLPAELAEERERIEQRLAAIEDVATRFGVSENHVKQRLRPR